MQALRKIYPEGINKENGCFAEIARLDKFAPEPRVGDQVRGTTGILSRDFKAGGESARQPLCPGPISFDGGFAESRYDVVATSIETQLKTTMKIVEPPPSLLRVGVASD